jgi:8-oxo-dGTP pyrophosphatase MutT (NUDIX family)
MLGWMLRRLRLRADGPRRTTATVSGPSGSGAQGAGGRTRSERAERRQVAALPWRQTETGFQLLLITSRETRRWVIPKGGRMPGKTDAEAAAQEALEEAGVEGHAARVPIGVFRYAKVLKTGAARWCVVSVYPLEVTVEHDDWQERAERERVWVSWEEAVRRVDEPDLKTLIGAFQP